MTTRFLLWLLPTLLVPATVHAQEAEASELDRMQREAEGRPANAPPEAAPTAETTREEPLGHEGQIGLRVGLGAPYVFAVKYGEGPWCDDTGEEFCHHLGTGLLDVELGFGVSETVELSGLVRFGLAEDVASNAVPIIFGIGARAYTSPSARFKGFLGGRAMLDITSSDAPNWRTVDVGVRGELGLQLDVVRYLGFYVQAGASIMLLRALYLGFDGTGGVQARFP